MHPLLLLYANRLQWPGWNSAQVMTCRGAPQVVKDNINGSNTAVTRQRNQASTTATRSVGCGCRLGAANPAGQENVWIAALPGRRNLSASTPTGAAARHHRAMPAPHDMVQFKCKVKPRLIVAPCWWAQRHDFEAAVGHLQAPQVHVCHRHMLPASGKSNNVQT